MLIDTPAWVRDAVFYQVFPDRFARSPRLARPGPLEPWDAPPTAHGFKGGDLVGLAERLPYLEELGVTALYMTPIFTSASNHRYHTDDYFSVDPLLGGDEALRELLDAAHARGMRVVLDGVFNHTGRGFRAFHHILENGMASPYLDWYHVDRARLAAGRPLIAYPEPGMDHGGRDSMERLGYRAWWGLPALPKLNTDHPPVREHLLAVAEHWLRFGIDGWRLDVPEEIADEGFWLAFRARCRAVRPDAYLVGEIWHEAGEWLRGDRFDAVMNYPLAQAMLGFAAGRSLDHDMLRFHHEYVGHVRTLDGAAFAVELERIMDLYDPAVTAAQLNLLGSHDTPRFLTLAGGDRGALRLAILLLAILPGAPCIYYGDEIGLEGGPDPDCRRAFPEDEARWDRELLGFTQAVLALRHATPALRHGSLQVAGTAGGAIALERADERERWVIALNAGETVERLAVSLPGATGRRLEGVALPGWPAVVPDGPVGNGDGSLELVVPPRSGTVLRVR